MHFLLLMRTHIQFIKYKLNMDPRQGYENLKYL